MVNYSDVAYVLSSIELLLHPFVLSVTIFSAIVLFRVRLGQKIYILVYVCILDKNYSYKFTLDIAFSIGEHRTIRTWAICHCTWKIHCCWHFLLVCLIDDNSFNLSAYITNYSITNNARNLVYKNKMFCNLLWIIRVGRSCILFSGFILLQWYSVFSLTLLSQSGLLWKCQKLYVS